MGKSQAMADRIKDLTKQYADLLRKGIQPDQSVFLANNSDIANQLICEFRRIESLFLAYNTPSSTNGSVSQKSSRHAKCNETALRENLTIRCPDCHENVDVLPDASWTNINCPSCETTFNLLSEDTNTFEFKKLNQFELLERVGEGGFGIVWKALDLELNRVVSVKLPRQERLKSVEAEQFIREARACAQIRHPNIVDVYEVGRCEDQVFIVSQFIEGKTLGRVISERRLAISDAVQLLKIIATALQCAHESGVIHRDLKPSNILIDRFGQPHITDFGLAKHEVAGSTASVDGAVLGTPAYMSPEQATGNAHAADERSDIYSLGVILFQLLTGELPFRGSTAMILNQVIHEDPPSLRKLNNTIPRDLETICLRCMEKQPSVRFHSAAEVSDELTRFLNNEPIASRPIGMVRKSIKWSHRNPLQLTILLLTFLLLSAGSLALLMEKNHSRAQIKLLAQKNEALQDAERGEKRALRAVYASDMLAVGNAIDEGSFLPAAALLEKYANLDEENDLREFEWYYYWNQVYSNFERVISIDEPANRLFATKDSKFLFAFDYHGSITVVDLQDNNSQRVISCEKKITSLWAEGESRQLVTSDLRGVVTVWENWDLDDKVEHQLHEGKICQLERIPDGSGFVTCGTDGSVRIWDSQFNSNGNLEYPNGQFENQTRPLANVEFAISHDSETVAVLYGQDVISDELRLFSSQLCVFDMSTKRHRWPPKTFFTRLNSGAHLAFSYSGEHIVVPRDGSSFQLISVDDGKQQARDGVNSNQRIDWIESSSDHRRFAGFTEHGSEVNFWDAITNNRQKLACPHPYITSTAWLDENRIASLGQGQIRLWDLASQNNRTEIDHPLNFLDKPLDLARLSVGSGSDNRFFLTVHQELFLEAWDSKKRERIATRGGRVSFEIVVSKNGTQAYYISENKIKSCKLHDSGINIFDKTINIFDKTIYSFDPQYSLKGIAISHDGKYLAVVCGDENRSKFIAFFDIDNEKISKRIDLNMYAIERLAFSPDDKTILFADAYGQIQRWTTRAPFKNLWTKHTGKYLVKSLAIAPDNSIFAISYNTGDVDVLTTQDARYITQIAGSGVSADHVSFSDSTKSIVVSSDKLRIWDSRNGQLKSVLGSDLRPPSGAFFTDSRTLVSTHKGGLTVFWDTSDDQIVDEFYSSVEMR